MTDPVEARLRRVEDELALRRLLADYSAFLDDRDYDSYVGLFAPDAEWTNPGGSYRGQAAIRAMLEQALGPAGAPNRSAYHLNSNARIDLDGDRATAVSRYLFVMRGPDHRPMPALAGIYRDAFVRQGGVWKIQRRLAEDIIPTHAEWEKISAAR
ncbi:MAG: nuclear transport factor 2 family protein [Sphingomonas sp.]